MMLNSRTLALLLFASLALTAVAQLLASPAAAADNRVNAVIGDESWHERHVTPAFLADEETRIRTHLEFVHADLAAADTSHLNPEQRANRANALRHLREYATAGDFPKRVSGDGFLGRRPRFIDDSGTHCAVGELIRTSGEPQLARAIDDRWEYAHVPEIESRELREWAHTHGFEGHELAMIQPMYMPENPIARFLVVYLFLLVFVSWGGLLLSALVVLPWARRFGFGWSAAVAVVGFFVTPLELLAAASVLMTPDEAWPIFVVAIPAHVVLTVGVCKLVPVLRRALRPKWEQLEPFGRSSGW